MDCVSTSYQPLNERTYQIDLPNSACYLSNLSLSGHPMVIDIQNSNITYKCAVDNLQNVKLQLDGVTLLELNEFANCDIKTVNNLQPVYSRELDFFQGNPLIPCALKGRITLLLTFKEKPLPFWLTFQLSWCPPHEQYMFYNTIQTPVTNHTNLGYYQQGFLFT